MRFFANDDDVVFSSSGVQFHKFLTVMFIISNSSKILGASNSIVRDSHETDADHSKPNNHNLFLCTRRTIVLRSNDSIWSSFNRTTVDFYSGDLGLPTTGHLEQYVGLSLIQVFHVKAHKPSRSSIGYLFGEVIKERDTVREWENGRMRAKREEIQYRRPQPGISLASKVAMTVASPRHDI